ncbi:MAG: hypothetical protein WC990_01540 [Sphaerochaetaceae bacterium]
MKGAEKKAIVAAIITLLLFTLALFVVMIFFPSLLPSPPQSSTLLMTPKEVVDEPLPPAEEPIIELAKLEVVEPSEEPEVVVEEKLPPPKEVKEPVFVEVDQPPLEEEFELTIIPVEQPPLEEEFELTIIPVEEPPLEEEFELSIIPVEEPLLEEEFELTIIPPVEVEEIVEPPFLEETSFDLELVIPPIEHLREQEIVEEEYEDPFLYLWGDDFDPDAWMDDLPEDDPWADFYVAGEEDYSIFEDGTYLVPLIVNEEYLDDISVIFGPEGVSIEYDEFKELMFDLVVGEVKELLFGSPRDYFTLDEFNEYGIETYYDYNMFELHMNFTAEMMPSRTLSITRRALTRYGSYSMSGSDHLKAAWMSWFTNFSMYSLIDLREEDDWAINPTNLFTMQAHSSLSLFGVAFNASVVFHPTRAYNKVYNSWSETLEDYLTFNGVQGFFDIRSKSLRVSFGHMNDYLGYDKESFGVSIEKRYNYGHVTPKDNQFDYEITVEEPSTVEIFNNEKSVYKRELQAGIYKLRDFAFAQGANRMKIVITSKADPSRVEEKYLSLGFDSRLLAKGDTLYSSSLTFPKLDFEKTTFKLAQQIGISNTVSGSYNLGFNKDSVVAQVGATVATLFGTVEANVGMSYSDALQTGLTARVMYRISGEDESPFGSFDTSLGYSSGRYNPSLQVSSTAVPSVSNDRYDLSLSYNGNIKNYLRYSISGSLLYDTSQTHPNWRVGFNTGIPLLPNLSVSASVSLSSSATFYHVNEPTISGQISVNYSLGPVLSISASSSAELPPNTQLEDVEPTLNISGSLRPFGPQNNTFQFSLNNISFDDPLSHQGSLSFSHNSPLYGFSIRQQYSDNFSRYTTSVSFSSAIAYANGMIGMTRSIGDNFVLVKPKGAMKGSQVAVTKTMTSDPSALPSFFGVGTYTSIIPHQQNNIVAYGVGDSLSASSGSFIYDLYPRPRQGYAITIAAEKTSSVVGTLLQSPNSSYSRYATDLYKVEFDKDGVEILTPDESLYIFTDEFGFFFVSGITDGVYQLSLFLPQSDEEDPPVDIRFVVKSDPKSTEAEVFVLETFIASDIHDALEQEYFDMIMGIETEHPVFDEHGLYHLQIEESMSDDQFWNEYFPSRELVDTTQFGHEELLFDEGPSVTLEPSKKADSALSKMRSTSTEKLMNLARLRAFLADYIDLATPLDGWRP